MCELIVTAAGHILARLTVMAINRIARGQASQTPPPKYATTARNRPATMNNAVSAITSGGGNFIDARAARTDFGRDDGGVGGRAIAIFIVGVGGVDP